MRGGKDAYEWNSLGGDRARAWFFGWCLVASFSLLPLCLTPDAGAAESFVIAASSSVRVPLEVLARAFERIHPEIQVRLSYEGGLDLRRTIAQVENEGLTVFEQGPIHLVAPGGDELIARLAQKQYVFAETRTVYATRPLVLVVPESLVDAPTSFESVAQEPRWRVAVADPAITPLGQETAACLESMGIGRALAPRLDVAMDARGVLDHLMRGEADLGILFGPDAVKEQERVRVVAVASESHHRPRFLSMAMERRCPNRARCAEFLSFIGSPAAQDLLKQLGYGLPLSSGHE